MTVKRHVQLTCLLVRAQTKLWDSNLWSIVTVQKKVRRFLAKKRAREINKAKQDMLSSGAWMIGWLFMIGLLVIGSSRERGAGGPTLLNKQIETFFDPPALPGGGRVSGVHSPESAWRWIQEILIPRYRCGPPSLILRYRCGLGFR